jgi:hypothetical protein
MATALTKTVTRKSNTTVFERGTRNIIVAIEPGQHGHADTIAVRPAGTRKWYRAELGYIADQIMMAHVDREKRDLTRRAKALNKGGIPMRTSKRMAREEQKQLV